MIGTSAIVRPMMLDAEACIDRNTTQLLANTTQSTGKQGCAAMAMTGVESSRAHMTHMFKLLHKNTVRS